MTPKRILICLAAAFLTTSFSDYLIHQVILKSDYEATLSLWRTSETMQQFMSWIFVSELVLALGMSMLWLRGFAEKACLKCVLGFGLFAGLVGCNYIPAFYAVMPLPGLLCVKWFLFGLLQSLLVTTVLYLLTRRKAV